MAFSLGGLGGILGGAAGFFLGGPAGALIGSQIGGGLDASSAAQEAAGIQAGAARSGIAEQRRQFDLSRQDTAASRAAGDEALAQQRALLGLGSPEEQEASMARFTESPGQQFMRNQQERSLLRNTAAIGGLGGGNVRTALQEQAFGRAQTDFSNQFNRLGALRAGGQAATAESGRLGAGMAGNIANLQASQGAARASGILGQQQARGQMLSGLAGLGGQFGLFGGGQGGGGFGGSGGGLGGLGFNINNPFPGLTT